MKTLLLIPLCALIFGSYDFAVKLASGSGNPTALALVVQLASVATLGVFSLRQPISKSFLLTPNLIYAIIAGILMGFALNLLLYLLKNSGLQASTIIPFTLIGRSLVLVTLSLLILRENLTAPRLLGLLLGLTSLFLINK